MNYTLLFISCMQDLVETNLCIIHFSGPKFALIKSELDYNL